MPSMPKFKPSKLLEEFILIPGPPGEEVRIRNAFKEKVDQLGLKSVEDAKGNLLIPLDASALTHPKVVITAHLDEIAMITRRILPDGRLEVTKLGGLYPHKIGEGPVLILADSGDINGILSFGSIHTSDPTSNARQSDFKPITWDHSSVFTGLSAGDLREKGVRPGTRVVIHPSRRGLLEVGPEHIAGFFLDDRADLVSMLLVLESLAQAKISALFIASASEEVGGEGALFALQKLRPDVCIALELGPFVADAPVQLTSNPTVWTHDSYSVMSADDGRLVAKLAKEIGIEPQFQSLSGGGSDASCAAQKGLVARPITLGLPMENTHGFEIMHKDAMVELARLTEALIRHFANPSDPHHIGRRSVNEVNREEGA